MEHKEIKRLNKNATVAVLFIHGITGTPNHFKEFVALLPESFSVYNLLLHGHGKSAKEFGKSSMRLWEKQVENAVNELSQTHQSIYIVSHSMGTLFSIEQAIKNPKIKKLFLLASPLKIAVKPIVFTSTLKVCFNMADETDPYFARNKECFGIEEDKNPFHYTFWPFRYFELFSKVRYVRKILPNLTTPCVAYQSKEDELVSRRALHYLKQNPRIEVYELKNSTHCYYKGEDKKFLFHKFKQFVGEMMNEN